MPFGLKDVPATFQKVMNEILSSVSNRYLKQDVRAYPDIMAFATTSEHSLELLEAARDVLLASGIGVSFGTCYFAVSSIKLLGFTLCKELSCGITSK